ncbi:hypothetical protein ACIGO9_31515 [Nocardia asteroides]|uniref:hypothetical protein n=1 Tax=Nocardia asteroides TaxID=1824 RepID=UPI0037C7A51C
MGNDAFARIVQTFELDGWHRIDTGADYASLEYYDRVIGFSQRDTSKVIGRVQIVLDTDGRYVVRMPNSNPFSTGAAAYRSFRKNVKSLQKLGLLGKGQRRNG